LGTPRLRLQVVHYAPPDLVTAGKEKIARAPRAVITPRLCALSDTAYIPDPRRRRDPLAHRGVRYAQALRDAGELALHYDIPQVDHAYNLYDPQHRSTTGNVHQLLAEHARHVVDTA
jgi:acetyl esterase